MLDLPRAAERDLSSLRMCVSGGEALPAAIHERWSELYGLEVVEGVGSSELYHIYISSRPGDVRPGSAGRIVPGYDACLRDEEGNEVPDGTPGELWVSGESAALCYWGDHERSKRTFHGSTVRTGDLFVRDEDGYFWYRGRADDLLKVGGIWVAPLEIENALLAHPAVSECAVAGYDEQGLVLARAWVVARAAVAPSELQDFLRARLSPHKVPREVRLVESLPKTASGKVDRRALREAEVPA
jgi:acyl-coenzyme A synthetase/AMP-(fatty) acid ligase